MNKKTAEQRIRKVANIQFDKTTLMDRINGLLGEGFEVLNSPVDEPIDFSTMTPGGGIGYHKDVRRETRGYFVGGGVEYHVGSFETTILGYLDELPFITRAHDLMLARREGAAGGKAVAHVHAIEDPTHRIVHYVALPDYKEKEKPTK